VSCLTPWAPGDSVRPRRLSGVAARPLNFTVRRHMSAPQTFRTSPGSYAVLCGSLSLPLILWVCIALRGSSFGLTALLIAIAMPGTAAVWLAYLRLRIDESGIEYRDLLGKSFRVTYSEVESLKTRWMSSRYGPYRQSILHLRDGRNLRINFRPFPGDAFGVLSERLKSDA